MERDRVRELRMERERERERESESENDRDRSRDRNSGSGRGNPYGYGLVAFGAGLAAFSWYLLQSTPMTALGIGVAVVGASIAITPTSPVPSKTVRKLLEGATLNIEAVLEDTGAKNRAYYVPGVGDDGIVRAFVPLGEDRAPARWDAQGLVVTLDGNEYLVVYPPGALLVKNEELSGDLESAMIGHLVEESGLVESVKVIEDGSSVVVEFRNPRARAGSGRVRRVLGSLEAGIAAALVAGTKGKVGRIASEEESGDGKMKRAVIELL